MQILYGYSNCSDRKYNELMKGKNVSILRPDQKYHGLLIKGLAKNGAKVKCFSGLPINRSLTKKILINEKDEQEENIDYHYYTTLNLPVLRQIMIFFGAFTGCLKAKKTKDTFAVCDCLNIANAYGMALACRIRKIPVITIVTDLPDMMSASGGVKKVNNGIFKLFSGYIFLTGQMNSKINSQNKPYIVLEGHVDADTRLTENTGKYEKSGKKVVLYAGAIAKIYGIKELVEGFILAKIPDCELWVFGDGDYKDELLEIAKENSNVKYMGICGNDVVVEHEKKASLLVNPRPSAPEYTKYSFPSKNMEYMVSATPVMTTKLPGMPDEYLPYVYIIEDETAGGIAESLKKFFKKPLEERENKGIAGRDFVLKNKSNIMQAKKIIEFLQALN